MLMLVLFLFTEVMTSSSSTGCSMVKDTTKPNWYGGVAIANPAGPGTYNPNWIYEFGPLSEQQCQDLCISTPACKRTGWRSNAHPESCTMFSSVGPYAPGQSVLVCYDKACQSPTVSEALSIVSLLSEKSLEQDIYSAFALIGLLALLRFIWTTFRKPSHSFHAIQDPEVI